MSEEGRAGIVYSGSSGELVTGGDVPGAPCWEPRQQERRWAATAAALETVCSSFGNRQPGRIVDLGCGSGELTTRIASLWPAADVVAVDQSDLMTLFTQGSALAAGHRNVRVITADVAGDLGIEPGSADLVVASCIANNMLNDIAGHCPDGGTDTVGYARWYHAWDTRPLPLLEQARGLLAAGGLLVSVEPNNHEFGIGAWGRMLARAGFTIVPGLSRPIEWECDCGCLIPLSVLQSAGDSFDQALAVFLAWLSLNGHALRGGNLDLRPEDAAALSGLAGEPLVDLRYRFDGRDVVLRAAELAPFLVYETAALRQLAASSSLPNLTALVTGRLADLRQLGIVPELTGTLAAPLLAASQDQEMPLP
jgi:SAM-dependent methyltransferase